jgi:hypothetical protein
LRFFAVHIGDHPSNQATTLESQMIPAIQYLPGQTLTLQLLFLFEVSEARFGLMGAPP